MIDIHFLGAAGTVTGSKYLVKAGELQLMVDCGLFQGLKKLRMMNWEGLTIDEGLINAVLLTHGHLDHCGYLPRLVRKGFEGVIYGTQPTLDIAAIILRDSAKIQEEEAKRANKGGYSKHNPAKPLYSLKDAERTIARFRPVEEGEWLDLGSDARARFLYNGHILGSTFVELEISGCRLVFSGDVGRKEDQLLRTYKQPERADVLFIESTYGGKLHPEVDLESRIQEIVQHTVEKEGVLIIPSFAVERAQILMYVLWQLREKGLIPDIPLIMDSPMGANVLEVFHKNAAWHKLSADECSRMCHSFQVIRDFKETMKVMKDEHPKVIIAGSGMLTGGRVLTYLQKYLERPETSILISGFQAEGTRGRALLEGASELKIYGDYFTVRAEIFDLQMLSAHADQSELVDWVGELKEPPAKVYIVHGEPHSSDALRVKLKDEKGWEAILPELYQIESIECPEKP